MHHADPNYSFVRNATEAPRLLRNYDYIIVGGGTAGCPLAATLSQNFTVLLLERGGGLSSSNQLDLYYHLICTTIPHEVIKHVAAHPHEFTCQFGLDLNEITVRSEIEH